MNINDTCNAFWDGGSINFYRSGGGCSNTGELAGVFDHEWGHGLDANDNNTGVSSPGEAIADVHGFLKLNNSCLGRNFQPGIECGGYGDTCVGTPVCTGVRDGDFANHRCGNPHDIRWINQPYDPLGITPCNPVTGTGGGCVGAREPAVPQLGPCGQETHCEGYVPAEAGWDVYKRDLQAPPFSFDLNTALELATRIAYIGGSFVGNWYQCTGPVGDGCNADSGYKTALAADDDDGDITNGTPHATAIYNAYNRHQIACDSGAQQQRLRRRADDGAGGRPPSASTRARSSVGRRSRAPASTGSSAPRASSAATSARSRWGRPTRSRSPTRACRTAPPTSTACCRWAPTPPASAR